MANQISEKAENIESDIDESVFDHTPEDSQLIRDTKDKLKKTFDKLKTKMAEIQS